MTVDQYIKAWEDYPPRLFGNALTSVRGGYGWELHPDRPRDWLIRACWKINNDIPVCVFLLRSLQTGEQFLDRTKREQVLKRNDDVEDWLYDNCQSWYVKKAHQIAFFDEEDAMMFKLTWGEE